MVKRSLEPSEEVGKEILKIVDESAGGTKLIPLLIRLFGIGVQECNEDAEQMIKIIEESVRHIPVLGILKYTCRMSDGVFREKMFVYRK